MPTQGSASFRIVATCAGEVIALDLVGSPEAKEGWADVAKAALLALKDKRLRMASALSGALFRIDVAVDVKLSTGQDPGLEVSVFGAN